MRPISSAPEAARWMRRPLRLAVSFSWTASNKAAVTIPPVLARVAAAPVVHLTEIDPVAQDVRERAVGQRHAADDPPGAERATPRDDAALPQLSLERWERAECEVALEDEPHDLGLVLPDHQLALAH